MRITRRTEIGLWLLVGVVSLGISIVTYKSAHSEAALHLKIDRSEALVTARDILSSQGYDVSQYQYAIDFDEAYTTKKFLEKQLGQDEANTLMGGDISTWYWDVRFYIPQQLEEFSVSLGPDGRLVDYEHEIEETAAGASLSSEAAEAIATAFLKERKHLDLTQYELIERSQEERPNRLDRSFTWKKKNFDREGATYRLYVTVLGDRVGYYSEYLDVPERWQEDQHREYSRRYALMAIAEAGSVVFLIYAFFLLVRNLLHPLFRYSFAALLGLFVFITNMLVFLNEYPTMWLYYNTTESVSVFIMGEFVDAVMGALPGTLIVLLAGYAASFVAIRAFPYHVPFTHVFTGVFWRSKPVLLAVVVGICLAFFHVAFSNLFYIVGRSIGVWCPLETPYTSAVALPMPWLVPFETGFIAALQEEIVFRLLAVSALLLLTKRRWLSILIPAIVWGFLHSNYPQEPIFIRGLELTLAGVIYGYVFFQYGIVATMVSHFTYNALLGSDFFLRSGNTYLIFCALIVLAIPCIPFVLTGLSRLRGKPFTSLDDVIKKPLREWTLSSKYEGIPWAVPEQYPAFRPLSKWLLTLFGVAACVGICVYFMGVPPKRIGDYIQVKIGRLEAQQRADAYLQSLGVDINRYRRLTRFDAHLRGAEADYCWQKGGMKELNRFFQTHFTDRGVWLTWYFRPGDQEQYWVSVTPDGRVIDQHHDIAEAAPGAKLSEQAARDIAIDRLREQGLPIERYTLVNVDNIERPNRLDHAFTFEDMENVVDEAHLRKSVVVQGDQIGMIRTFLKLPEKWKREHDKHYWWEIAAGICFALIVLVYLFRWGLLFSMFMKRNLLFFRPYIPVVLASVVSYFLDFLNTPGVPWASYDVAEEITAFWTQEILFVVCLVGVGFIAWVLICGYANASLCYVFPACRPLIHWFRPKSNDTLSLRLVWGEALLMACFVSFILVGLLGILPTELSESHADSIFASVRDCAPMPIDFDILEVRVPALYAMTDAIFYGFFGFFLGMSCFSLYKLYWSGPVRLTVLSVVLGFLTACANAENVKQGVLIAVTGAFLFLLFVGLVVLLVRHVFRDNIPAYLLTLILPGILYEGLRLAGMSNAFYRINGVVLLACFGLSGVVGLWLYISGMWKSIPAPESGVEDENSLLDVE